MATITRPRYTDTHCGHGHELDGNFRMSKGQRRCLTCQKKYKRESDHGKGAQDWWELKVLEQDGKCAICDKFFGDSLCLDHDHETGEWRALLCKFCNLMVGWIETRRDMITEVEIYLNQFEGEV